MGVGRIVGAPIGLRLLAASRRLGGGSGSGGSGSGGGGSEISLLFGLSAWGVAASALGLALAAAGWRAARHKATAIPTQP